jgi:hypothetical protein
VKDLEDRRSDASNATQNLKLIHILPNKPISRVASVHHKSLEEIADLLPEAISPRKKYPCTTYQLFYT